MSGGEAAAPALRASTRVVSPAAVAAAATLRGFGRGLRPRSPWDASGVVALAGSALAVGLLEGWGLWAAVRLSRRALAEMPSIQPAYLLERLLQGTFGATVFLLVLGALTTAVSTLFLSDELAFRATLPIPHRRLLLRQLVRTVALASGPSVLLAIPAILVATRASGRPAVACGALSFSFLAVVVGAGSAGAGLAVLLVLVFPPRRARLLAAFLSAAGLATALVGFRSARPERLFDPASALELLERAGSTPPAAPGLDPLAWAARAATLGLGGEARGLLLAAALVAVTSVLPVLLAAVLAPLHFRLFLRTREGAGSAPRSRGTRRPAASLGAVLLRAEAATFLRDAATPAQLGTLAAVFLLDLLNLKLLPTTDAGARDLVAGLQTALALFLVSALALRFAFPSVSGDGRAALVLRSLPLSPVRHLWARYAVRGLPSAAVAVVLVGVSLVVLRPGREASLAALAAALAGGIAIPALHLGLGALFPRYGAPDAISVALGPGGLFAMALSTVLAIVPAAFVSDGVRNLLEALSGHALDRGPLLAAWAATSLACGLGALLAAARRLPRIDVSGG